MAEDVNGLRVPERIIPIPDHISPEARGFLSASPPFITEYPALADKGAWKRHVEACDAMCKEFYLVKKSDVAYDIRERREDGALAYEVTPPGVTSADRRVFLDIHGGALFMGGGEVCRAMALATVARIGARIVSVDYRMPPDHPYPAGLDDCVTFYRALLRDHRPEDIIVGGGSAGANLAAATILRIRDEGLPLPAAAVLLSPEADLTESGDTFQTNAVIDGMGSLMDVNRLYADGHDLTHPYLSPLFADFGKGFPPTLLSAGTRDVFLSNAARFHRALRAVGVQAELHVIEAAPHGNFGGTSPEEAELDHEVRGFCAARWSGR